MARLNGVFATVDQPGPRHRCVAEEPGGRAAGSCPSSRTMISHLPHCPKERRSGCSSKTPIRRSWSSNAADLAIHPIDHRGVNGHLVRLKTALLLRERIPGQGTIDLTGTEQFQGRGKVIRRADIRLEIQSVR